MQRLGMKGGVASANLFVPVTRNDSPAKRRVCARYGGETLAAGLGVFPETVPD